MIKKRNYKITESLLDEYQQSAFKNSSELLLEATDLLHKKYYARAYFIGCASLEETGKAYLAFSSKGRNLDNPNVQHVLKMKFEDHEAKIIASIVCLLREKEITKSTIQYFIDLATHMQYGREKAMYVDVSDDGKISIPSDIVRPKAASDCIRLAKNSLNATIKFTSSNLPIQFSAYHDKALCINNKKTWAINNEIDFWEYYIDMLSREASADWLKALVKYHDEYFCKNKKFQANVKLDTQEGSS